MAVAVSCLHLVQQMGTHALRTIGVGAVYFVACYVALVIDTTNGAAWSGAWVSPA